MTFNGLMFENVICVVTPLEMPLKSLPSFKYMRWYIPTYTYVMPKIDPLNVKFVHAKPLLCRLHLSPN